jgi:hypothetical protein
METDLAQLKTDVSELKVVIGWLRWIGTGIVMIALALVANLISNLL